VLHRERQPLDVRPCGLRERSGPGRGGAGASFFYHRDRVHGGEALGDWRAHAKPGRETQRAGCEATDRRGGICWHSEVCFVMVQPPASGWIRLEITRVRLVDDLLERMFRCFVSNE